MEFTNVKRVVGFESYTLENKIKKNLGKKKDTGDLQKSISVDYVFDENVFTITLTEEDYAYYVDQGRKPGKKGMPVNKLKEWIKRKKLTVKDANGKTLKMTDSRLNGLSFVINRKIREEGIKATYLISKPIDAMLDNLGDRIAEAFMLDIDNELQKEK